MKAWRESASLIIAAKNGLKQSQSYDYDLLLIKRQQTAKFAGAFVFPGGLIEAADADLKWKNLYENHEISFKSLIPNLKNRPEIFKSKENELPREISLRITAIRETFEECGILLCKKLSGTSSNSKIAEAFPISNDEIEFWQDKVHCDANEFYNMCERLQCYPNLWALYEWGNWLTPAFFPQRFNTAFFFACLSKIPNSKPEQGEVEEVLWATPEHTMTSLITSLPPPQQYEISKISKYRCVDNLLEFAVEKSRNGIQLYLPVRVMLKDGSVHLLPGDSMYPSNIDLYKKEIVDMTTKTIKEFRELSKNIHRSEFYEVPDYNINHFISKL